MDISNLELYEIDSLDIVYRLISRNELILSLIDKENIFKYSVPEEFVEQHPIVRISPISEVPKEFGDNLQLAWDCIVQIDVWDSDNPRLIALEIHRLMKTLNFKQEAPTFELDSDTDLIRDGRRYRGIIMSNINKEKENE